MVPSAISGTEPQLPPLDFVLLSHNHYDHLDTGSVRTLNKRYGKVRAAWYGRTWVLVRRVRVCLRPCQASSMCFE